MTPRVRALVLIDAFRMGGAETLLAPMITAARDSDVQMDVMSVLSAAPNSAKTMEILADAGIATHSLGIRRLLDPAALPRLTSVIRRGGYDVVHAHLEYAITLAVPAAALARRPAHLHLPSRGASIGRTRGMARTAGRGSRKSVVSRLVRIGGIAAVF